jgi:4-amino-4-deoxy-L-arabinose transferase-like glycosyltransferase
MTRLRAAVPALLVATLILRAPGFVWKVLGIDDADFTVIARAMMHGAVPYRDVVDIKPPLAFALYLPNALFGEALWPTQVEAVLFIVGSALALGLAAQRTWGERAGVTAAALTLAAGVCEAPTVSTELLMTLPTALALALHARVESGADARSEGSRPALLGELSVGALLGVAALIRHQAVFTLGALGLATILLGLRGRRPWFARCVALTVGFAAPWALTMALFERLGALPDFLDWVILRNVRYVGQSSGSAALRLVQAVVVCIVLAAPLAWWSALVGLRVSMRDAVARATDDAPARLRATWALLMIVSLVPVSLGGRFYEHYFLQLVPAVALLGAGPLEALLARARGWSRGRKVALAVLAFGPPIGAVGYATARGVLGQYPLQNERVRAIGAWARASTAPDARLFVWGHFSPIYLAANRLPGTRYITTSWQLGNFDPQHIDDAVDLRRFRSDRDVAQTIDDLRRRKPDWVIDTTPADIHAWHRLPLRLLPDLERAIDEDFVPIVASPGGARVLERRVTASGAGTR